jgi:peptidoglycan-N-acetylglucosamine deacetylase
MKAVAEAGHEIGIHGYSHENPIAMTREQGVKSVMWNLVASP